MKKLLILILALSFGSSAMAGSYSEKLKTIRCEKSKTARKLQNIYEMEIKAISQHKEQSANKLFDLRQDLTDQLLDLRSLEIDLLNGQDVKINFNCK